MIEYALIIIAIIVYIYFTQLGPIYFDNNATTHMSWSALLSYIWNFRPYNASSFYDTKSKKILDDFRAAVLRKLFGNVDHGNYRVIITSGASESNNAVIHSIKEVYNGKRALIYENEHKTSLKAIEDYKHNKFGTVDELNALIKKNDVVFVSHMLMNNETGDIFNIDPIARMCRAKNIWFHSDITQYFGKLEFDEIKFDPGTQAIYSISMHKCYGPLGVGALIVPKEFPLTPLIHGSQNYGLRGGTENIPAIAAATTALSHVYKTPPLKSLTEYFMTELRKKIPYEKIDPYVGLSDVEAYALSKKQTIKSKFTHTIINCPGAAIKNVNTVLLSFICKYPADERFCNLKLREFLTKKNIMVSIGSACNTGEKSASHVLMNLKLPFIIRCGVIRVSFGHKNTKYQVDKFIEVLLEYLTK